MLDSVLDLALSADARRVDQVEYPLVGREQGVDGVAGRSGDVRDDRALLADHAVDDRGFAGIRLSDDGDVDPAVVILLFALLGEVRVYGVEQIACAKAVQRRDGDGIGIKAKLVELVKLGRRLADLVGLVDGDDDRLAALFEHRGDLAIVRDKSRLGVNEEDDDVGRLKRYLGLKAHLS